MNTPRVNPPTNAGAAKQTSDRSRVCRFAAAALLGALATVAPATAAGKPQPTRVLEVDTSFVGTGGFDVHANKPPAVGQGVLIEGGLYELVGHKQGSRTGPLHVTCTFTDSAGSSVCTAVLALPAGKLVVSGRTPSNPGKPYTMPILGGSGRYAHAKGHVVITTIGNSNKAIDTIVLTS